MPNHTPRHSSSSHHHSPTPPLRRHSSTSPSRGSTSVSRSKPHIDSTGYVRKTSVDLNDQAQSQSQIPSHGQVQAQSPTQPQTGRRYSAGTPAAPGLHSRRSSRGSFSGGLKPSFSSSSSGSRYGAIGERERERERFRTPNWDGSVVYESDEEDENSTKGDSRKQRTKKSSNSSNRYNMSKHSSRAASLNVERAGHHVPLLSDPEEARGFHHSRNFSGGVHGDDRSGLLAGQEPPPYRRASVESGRSRHSEAFQSQAAFDEDVKRATRKRYTYAGVFLALSLVSFVVQTETAVYVQKELGWVKPYCMLYLTHGSWVLLYPAQLIILRIRRRNLSWSSFWRRHIHLIHTTAQMVHNGELHLSQRSLLTSPIPYFARAIAAISCALTVAGCSWYVAVDLTTPSDLTAIYNCSAFFAYAFSIPLLKDKLRADKVFSVVVAIVGVLIVAYSPSSPTSSEGSEQSEGEESQASNRMLGNIIIGVGSVLYGLYEVLYKRYACPPDGTSAGRGVIFSNAIASLIGLFTLSVLWIPLPILHVLGLETFELPSRHAAFLLMISTISNAVFSGSFLVLISLTSPVLSSVAALLTIFLVAIVDWLLHHVPLSLASMVGGLLIIVAFVLLAWSTYRELDEKRRKQIEDEGGIFPEGDGMDEDED